MKERPILFTGPMVRAILADKKTQTRRIVTTREPLQFIGGRGEEADPDKWGWFFDGPDHHGYMVLGRGHDERHDHGITSIRCPHGEPGDRLWVKETFSTDALTVYPCPPSGTGQTSASTTTRRAEGTAVAAKLSELGTPRQTALPAR